MALSLDLRGRTLASHVASEIHQLILSGELPPGSAVRIQDMAERLDTSVMPVREALRQLDALGIVEVVPHKGARVAELTREDLEDTYRTRIALESIAMGQAAAHFTADDEATASAALQAHLAHLADGDIVAARRSHTEFHFALYRASQSKWLLRSIEPPWRNSERYRFAVDSGDRSRSNDEHAEMLAACTAGDAERAAEALTQHLQGALARIRAGMPPALMA